MIRDRGKELARLHFEHAPREEPSSNGHKPPGSSSRTDEEVIEKIRAERNGKFERLWSGDLSDYGGDHSTADDGFVHKVWSYTRDPEQVKRIHAASGLHRPDKSGRRLDYLDRSIKRAERNVTWSYEWPGEAYASVSGRRKDRAGGSEDGSTVPEKPRGILLSEVKPERVRWAWKGRIPFGKITVADGNPGTGKSAMTTDLAARMSVGKPWPDGSECEAGGVVICSAEDGLADTIRPRLDAAGGDPSKVVALSVIANAEGDERQLAIPHDIQAIVEAIERVGAALVIIDPLMAFLPGDVNSHRDQDVRRALAPLARMGERTGAAIVIVRHLNKAQGGDALFRGGGSIGIVGAARSGLLIAKHPEDDERRVMAAVKNNLAPPAPSLVFGLSEAENGAVRVDWKGESILDASTLLSAPTDPEERSVLQEAKDLIREMLSEGPAPASDIKQEARSADISERTLKTAKRELGVLTNREGEAGKRGGGQWVWELPRIKGVNSTGLHPKSGSADEGSGNSAYVSQKQAGALRGQSDEGIKGAKGNGLLNEPLPAGAVASEIQRSNSGPAMALATYLDKPTDERLKWLVCAVLAAKGMDTAVWKLHAEPVKEAAGDPRNHPLDCECGECL